METNHYSYNGKSWRPSPTMSDRNSFFHSAFGVKTDENGYFDKLATYKRMQWITFLTYFEYETMPSCLTDMLRKCFSVNEKCKNVCGNDKQNLTMYISDLKTSEQAITKEEVAILATLENTMVVILSNDGLHPVTVTEPNPNIFGNYPKEVSKEEPKEVVLYLEGNIFTKLEPVREEQRPKPIKNKVQKKKTDPTKYRKGGSAGSKGVEYQISLIAMVMLNAMKSVLNEWKLSTENDEAGKFDDIVLEWNEGAVLIQSKHKEDTKKRITLEELTSTSFKKDNFSLPKYFLSYMLIKEKFNIKNLIICTNADVHENALNILNRRTTNTESLLHYEDGEYSFYTLKDTVVPVFKEKTTLYYDQNFKNKGIQKSVITKENLSDFLTRLQLFFNYPSQTVLEQITEQLLSLTECCNNSQGQITQKEMYPKLMEWFQQKQGVYFTKIYANAMFAEIWTNKSCEKLKFYKVSLQKYNLNFQGPKQLFYVTSSHGNLLQAIKVYYTVRNDKILFVNPDDDVDTQKLMLEAFALPQYVFLIINQLKVIEESVIKYMCAKLRNILGEKKYKKVILMTRNNDIFSKYMVYSKLHYESMDVPVTFADLSKDFQEKLLKKKSIVFQGKSVCLKELLADRADYANAVDQEILENLIAEKVKVGVQPTDMDENIAPFYINRTFKRSMEEIHEKDIYDVKEKAVLISDNAGVGKSTVFSKLATNIKERNPHLWVIKVAITEYTHLLRNLKDSGESISIMKLLNSKNSTKLTNHLERFVFSIEEKVVLMLDGVDEISPDYTELVHNLLTQCLQATNFAKLFVTTRPHMVQELKEIWKVDPFELQPFTKQDQVDFLIGYWTHKLDIPHENKEKCEKYARVLLERMSCWTEGYRYGKDKFTAIALQLRMVAEIFQETITLNEFSGWEGCKEYLESTNESPILPGKIELKELYDLFIERKSHIYIQKGNPSGNSEANAALEKQFNESLTCHKILALKVILSEKHCRLFSCYQGSYEVNNESVLKIGIVQRSNEGFYFIHRTFAEYFMADSLVSELQLQSRHPNLRFQEFFIDFVLTTINFEIIRAFLESCLQNVVDSIPSNIFKIYQSQGTNFHLNSYRDSVIILLVREDCVAILQLILKCIDFKIIKNRTYSGKDLHQNKNVNLENLIKTMIRENIAANTLNALKIVLQDVELEFWDWNGNTPLGAAAARGNLKMVKFLIDQGARVNSSDKLGFTALHWAIESDIIKYLVQHGAEMDCRSAYTPLHSAAAGDHLEMVRFLVEQGAKVSSANENGITALHLAVKNGHMNIAKYLVQQGAEIDYRSLSDYTPLHVAAARSDLECFHYPIKSGAAVTIRNNTVLHSVAMRRFNESPMDLAVIREQQAIIEFLVEHDEDITIKDKDGNTPLHFAARDSHLHIVKPFHEWGGNLNIRNNHAKIALYSAAEYGRLDVIKYLHEVGTDLNIRYDHGGTALHFAAFSGHLDVIKYLCEAGTDLNTADNNGWTALHSAAFSGYLDVVKYLYEEGVDLNVTDITNLTALHSAAFSGHLDVVKYLHEEGVDLNVTDITNLTALHSAAFSGHLDVVKYLHEKGVDLNVKNVTSVTALHLAASAGHLDVVKYLREAGTDLNITNNNGGMALHLAAFYGRLDVVKYLREAGTNLNVTDNKGKTALHLAACSGHLNVVKYLHEKGVDLNVTDFIGVTTDHIKGVTALHSAASNGHLDVVKYLRKAGTGANITVYSSWTVLHVASLCGHLDVVQYLHKTGTDLNVTGSNGEISLHLAAFSGHLDVIKYLHEVGTDLNITDNDGKTALHFAVSFGRLDIVKYLHEAGTDLNITDNNGKMALHLAADSGHLNVVKYLHEAGTDLNITDDRGRTPLHSAAASGRLDVVKYLREAGTDLNIADNYNKTPRQLAAFFGYLEVVKYLREAEVDLNIADDLCRTQLHSAAASGHLDIVKNLREAGINLNVADNNGKTAMHFAALSGHLDVVKYLREAGINLNVADNNGKTAMHFAAFSGHLDVVKYLHEKGVDLNVTDFTSQIALHSGAFSGHLDIIKYLHEAGSDLNITDNNGKTALHFAGVSGHLDVVKYLHEKGVDLNVTDITSVTALQSAAFFGHLNVVKYLHAAGTDLNITDNNGKTALHFAVVFGHLDVVKYLHVAGTDLNITDNNGKTALHFAVIFGHLELVKYLHEKGVDLNVIDFVSETALHSAVFSGHLDIIKYLHEAGTDLDITDNNGKTAVHVAASSGHLDIVKYLHEAGTDTNITDNNGNTALHIAANFGRLDVVKYLREAGTDLNVTNNSGSTPLHLASFSGYLDVVKYLREA